MEEFNDWGDPAHMLTPGLYWLWVKMKSDASVYPNAGKWLIFVSRKWAASAWAKVAQATHDGELGVAAKISTAWGSDMKGASSLVICVYTRDADDKENIMHVREKLREMGWEKELRYKRDDTTRAGFYGSEFCIYTS